MKRIRLRNTPIESSILGFGCASLTMHDERRAAVKLLDAAFDRGITHFDVARLYGFGQAEGIVGEFARGKRDRITIATKFGLQPNAALAKHRRLVNIARRVVHRFGFLRSFVRRRSRQLMSGGAFDPQQAASSRETSLRELQTDYVDILLLHECTLDDANRPDLLAFLDQQVTRGTVRCYGLGTAFENLRDDADRIAPSHAVLQFANSAMNRNRLRLRGASHRGIITHSAIVAAQQVAATARAQPAAALAFKQKMGIDLTDAGAAADALLRYAIADNPEGIVLVGTTRAEHLAANVASAAACDGGFEHHDQLHDFLVGVGVVVRAQAQADSTSAPHEGGAA